MTSAPTSNPTTAQQGTLHIGIFILTIALIGLFAIIWLSTMQHGLQLLKARKTGLAATAAENVASGVSHSPAAQIVDDMMFKWMPGRIFSFSFINVMQELVGIVRLLLVFRIQSWITAQVAASDAPLYGENTAMMVMIIVYILMIVGMSLTSEFFASHMGGAITVLPRDPLTSTIEARAVQAVTPVPQKGL